MLSAGRRLGASVLRRGLTPHARRRFASEVVDNCGTDSEKMSRWGTRLAHDNTFLSYHRNAIISTIAGSALVQYRAEQRRPPVAAMGLFSIGAFWMYMGSGLYLYQIFKLRHSMRLSNNAIIFGCCNAAFPVMVWTLSVACILDETPAWLLDGLAKMHAAGWLPAALQSSFFLKGETLQPVTRLLEKIQEHERARLSLLAVSASARPPRRELSPTERALLGQPERVLIDHEYVAIISARLERLEALHARLLPLSQAGSIASTVTVLPLLDKLETTIEQLEVALDAEVEKVKRRGVLRRWYSHTQQDNLEGEIQAVTALRRRCIAVKADSDVIE